MTKGKRITNPLEEKIAVELKRLGIVFATEGTDIDTNNLDFRLMDSNVYIEIKAFHSDRIAKQMSRVDNVIAIQGIQAVEWFVELLRQIPE